jgi:outer membrane protein assembly factor BamB
MTGGALTVDRLGRRMVCSLRLVAVAIVSLLAGCNNGPMIAYNAAHPSSASTDATIGVGNVGGLREVWTAATPDEIVSAPSIAGGVAYVGTRDNKLYAFSANGTTGCSGTPKRCRPLWSTSRLGGDVVSTPAVANGMVYVGSVGEKMFAFDAAGAKNCSGTPKVCRPLWSRTMSGDVIAPPTVARGVVYVIAAHAISDELDALDGATGALRWGAIVDTDLSFTEHSASAVAVANGIAYAGFYASDADVAMVAAFDAKGVNGCSGVPHTCKPLWTAPLGDALQARTPVSAYASLFASSTFGLNVYDSAGVKGCSGAPKTCSPLWSGAAPPATPTVANGIVFVGNIAFDALGKTGCSGVPKTCMPLWTDASGNVGAVANGVVYAISNAAVTAYDAGGKKHCSGRPTSCKALWSTPVKKPTSPVVANGTLWIGSTDHHLHAYRLR